MVNESYCLGLAWLGTCPEESQALFTIGEAVAVVALFLAFYQLSTPLTRMRLRTRWIPEKYLFVIFRSGLYFVFLAAALRLINGQRRIPVIHHPIFWEIIAGIVLVVSGLALIRFAYTPAQLSRRTAREFLGWNQTIIATGGDDDLRQLGHEIRMSLNTVAMECAKWSRRMQAAEVRKTEDKTEVLEAREFTKVCYSLLDTWSDARFCNTIVCRCPGTEIDIFKTLSQHHAVNSAYALGSELVHQAVSDHQSILHREGGFSGLGRHKLFLNAVFGDITILRSSFNPLGGWHIYRDKDISTEKIERWGDALNIALDAIIQQRDTWGSAHAIREGLDTLNNACTSVLADRERKQLTSVDDRLTVIYGIGRVFGNVIEKISESKIELEENITADTYDQLKDRSLHGDVAHELFDFFGHVATIDDWSVLHGATIHAWMTLFPHKDENVSKDLRALQIRMVHHIKEKLQDNLNLDVRYYPAITKLLITMYWLHEPQREACSELEYELALHFHNELKSKFVTLWMKNAEFASDLLPSDVEFDAERLVLRQSRFRRRESQELRLNPAT